MKLVLSSVNALEPLRLRNIYSLSLLASLLRFSVATKAQQPTQAGLITIESAQQTADNSIGVVTAQGNVRLIHVDRGIAVSYTHLTLPTKRIV